VTLLFVKMKVNFQETFKDFYLDWNF